MPSGEHVANSCPAPAHSGFQLAVDPHAIDAVAGEVQALDVLAEAELHAQLQRHVGQLGGEQLAVAGLVVGQAQGASENILHPGQGRLDAGNAIAVQQFVRYARLLEHGDILGRSIDLGLGTEQLGGAQAAVS